MAVVALLDRSGERRWHLAGSVALAALTLAAVGCFSCAPGLFAVAPPVLGPEEAPAGVAIIDAPAQLGPLAGPCAVGWIGTETGSFRDAPWLMAASAAASAVLAAPIRPPPSPR